MTETPGVVPDDSVSDEIPPLFPDDSPGETLAGMWRAFFSVTGGSVLYCLSALSIIYGLAQMLGPLLAQPHVFRDALPCLGALNIYEIALMAVLVLIVVWQNVTDDAVSLVVLVALFLIGGGIALSTVANSGPRLALFVGCACLAVGWVKVFILRWFIGLNISTPCLGALAAILTVNFGAGVFLARTASVEAAARENWLIAWLILLAGGVTVLVDTTDSCLPAKDDGKGRVPFLRCLPMFWIFAAILLVAAGVHQYVLGYVFDVASGFGDYLPLIGVVSLLAIRFSVTLRGCAGVFETGLALVPLAACVYAILTKSVMAGPIAIQWLWHPPVFLGLMGIAVLWTGFKTASPSLMFAFAGYLLGVILTIGFSPANPHALNWQVFGLLLVSGLFIVGLLRQNVALCFFAVILATGGLATTHRFDLFTQTWGLVPPAAIVGIGGLWTLLVALIFGSRMPRTLLAFAALGVMAFAFDFVLREPGWRDVVIGAALLALCAALWYRVRDWLPLVILCIPIACRLWLTFTKLTAWRYVILSFMLLVAGAWISIQKGKKSRRDGGGAGGQGLL